MTASAFFGDGSHLTGIGAGSYLPITGGTLTGQLTIEGASETITGAGGLGVTYAVIGGSATFSAGAGNRSLLLGNGYAAFGDDNTAALPTLNLGGRNHGLYSTAGGIGFAVSGANVGVWTAGGLGIGTVNPISKLHVYETAAGNHVLAQDGTRSMSLYTDSLYAIFGTTTNHAVQLGANNGAAMLNLNPNGGVGIGSYGPALTAPPANGLIVSGNLGVGTSSPNDRFVVIGPNANTGAEFGNLGTNAAYIQSYDRVGGAYRGFEAHASSVTLDYNGATPGLTLNSSGLVGIGTASPMAKFDVYNNVASFNPLSHYRCINPQDNGSAWATWCGMTYSARITNTDGKAAFGFNEMASFGLGDFVWLLNNTSSDAGLTTADEKMRLTRNGFLGVGTTSPNSKLHLSSGTLTIDGTGSGIDIKVPGFSDTPGVNVVEILRHTDNTQLNALRFDNAHGWLNIDGWSGSSWASQMTFDRTNNRVGIGATIPATKFHVSSGTLTVDGTGATISVIGSNPQIGMTNTNGHAWNMTEGVGGVTNDFQLYESPGAGSLVIKTGGNVGIGTTNPQDMLHLSGVANAVIRQQDTESGGITALLGTLAVAGEYDLYNLTNTEYFLRYALGKVSLMPAGGNVGIGTTSPNSKLHLSSGALTIDGTGADSIQAIGNIHANTNATNGGGVYIGEAGVEALLSYNSNGNLDIRPRSGYNTNFAAGNVGIGTEGPATLLDVNGSAQFGSAATKSTFSATGGLAVPYGISAASATFTATNITYDVVSSSGFNLAAGGLVMNSGSYLKWPDGTIQNTGSTNGSLTAGTTATLTAPWTTLSSFTATGAIQSNTGFVFPDGSLQTTAAVDSAWQSWISTGVLKSFVVPAQSSMVFVTACGGGGGGGRGGTGGTNKTGGGGGGSGYGVVMLPLPGLGHSTTIYISQFGSGGAQETAGTATKFYYLNSFTKKTSSYTFAGGLPGSRGGTNGGDGAGYPGWGTSGIVVIGTGAAFGNGNPGNPIASDPFFPTTSGGGGANGNNAGGAGGLSIIGSSSGGGPAGFAGGGGGGASNSIGLGGNGGDGAFTSGASGNDGSTGGFCAGGGGGGGTDGAGSSVPGNGASGGGGYIQFSWVGVP